MAIRADAALRAYLESIGISTRRPGGARACAPGRMNVTESRYASLLELQRVSGEVLTWEFEPGPLTLCAASRCSYRPDFRVVFADGLVEFHEVKGGYIREDALIKLKWAASKYSAYQFRLCRYRGRRWMIDIVPHD